MKTIEIQLLSETAKLVPGMSNDIFSEKHIITYHCITYHYLLLVTSCYYSSNGLVTSSNGLVTNVAIHLLRT